MRELDGLLTRATEAPFTLTFRTVVHSDAPPEQLMSPLYRFER